MSKIIVVGANHAGTAAVRTILQSGQGHEVVVYEANDNISFMGCGLALWLGRQIDSADELFYSNVEELTQMGAKVYIRTQVTEIDFERKTLRARNKCGNSLSDSYDQLILATGSKPREFPVPGLELENILFAKRYQDALRAHAILKEDKIRRVAVVGAGYIGVELAEACVRLGKETTLIDITEDILSVYFDSEFSGMVEQRLIDKGVKMALGQRVNAFEGNYRVERVVTDRETHEVDAVFFCVGFDPNTKLGGDKLKTLPNGAYEVNERQQTSLPDVYAIGDCASVIANAEGKQNRSIALATNAVRAGIVAGMNVAGVEVRSPGVQGSNALCIDGLKMVSTGLSVASAKKQGIEVCYSDFCDTQKPGFMKKDNPEVKIRIVYRKADRVVVGAQMISEYDMTAGIHMYSLAIQEGLTVDRLKLLDIFFMPHFNQPYSYYMMAAIGAQ